METLFAACLLLAAQTYALPPVALMGIYQVEGGQVGQEVGPNENGSYDLGPMQINTLWLPELADAWGVNESTARTWLRDDPCTNAGVSAWILSNHYQETRDLSKAISYYHSRTPRFGNKYQRKVLASIGRHDLVGQDQ